VKKEKEEIVKTSVVYACQHNQDINLTGTKNVREGKKDRKFKKSLCRTCYAKALDLGLAPTVQVISDLKAVAEASETPA
jgi:hypothetical protein